jgi:predicted nicotinamide N-methyase
MPGYLFKHETIAVVGAPDLIIRSLFDRQQFADPSGHAEALGISAAAWPLFGLVWPSGLQLAAAMAVRVVRASERVLEIGCGLGLASLVLHRRGGNVTASDCHPLAGGFLRENLRLNALSPMSYCHGHWGAQNAQAAFGPLVDGLFDLIIGSDVLYERDEEGVLSSFIGRHGSPVCEVMIIDPDRGNRSPFHRRMAAMGYSLEETRIRQPMTARAHAYSGRLLHYRRQEAAVRGERDVALIAGPLPTPWT